MINVGLDDHNVCERGVQRGDTTAGPVHPQPGLSAKDYRTLDFGKSIKPRSAGGGGRRPGLSQRVLPHIEGW